MQAKFVLVNSAKIDVPVVASGGGHIEGAWAPSTCSSGCRGCCRSVSPRPPGLVLFFPAAVTVHLCDRVYYNLAFPGHVSRPRSRIPRAGRRQHLAPRPAWFGTDELIGLWAFDIARIDYSLAHLTEEALAAYRREMEAHDNDGKPGRPLNSDFDQGPLCGLSQSSSSAARPGGRRARRRRSITT
jgi:hypothetical protein